MDWLINAIQTAKSFERLDCLKNVIKDDQQDKADYTLDTEYMEQVRQAWIQKQQNLKSSSKPTVK